MLSIQTNAHRTIPDVDLAKQTDSLAKQIWPAIWRRRHKATDKQYVQDTTRSIYMVYVCL